MRDFINGLILGTLLASVAVIIVIAAAARIEVPETISVMECRDLLEYCIQ